MAYFRKRANGWEYRISYKTPDGKFKQKSKSGFRTKALASAAAIEAERQLNYNIFEDDQLTLYDYFKSWSEIYKRPHITEKTWQSYLQTQRHITTYFPNTKLKDITPTQYQQVLNDFGENYSQETLERTHYHIKSAVKVAIREGLILQNFTEAVTVKSRKQKKDKENNFLQEEEYLELIETARQHIEYISYFTIYLIAVTGMRYAEASGLTWDDIDFEHGFLDINKTWDYSISKNFADTKNETSKRKIPLDQQTLSLLSAFKRNHYKDNPDNRILYGTSNSGTNKTLKKLVGRNVHIHSLRHTYASYLISKGIDLISISQLLGHENLNITLKVYAHQLEKLKEKNHDHIKKIFSSL